MARSPLATWLLILLPLVPWPAAAEDSAFLWAATGSPDDLGLRTGVALDMPGRPRLGAESNLRRATPTNSGTAHPPMRLWGEVDLRRAAANPASVGLTVDLVSGAARAALRQSRALMDEGPATLSLDRALEAGRRTDGDAVFIARQNLRLFFGGIDTTVTGGVVMDSAAPFHAEFAVEKRLQAGIKLRAVISDIAHEPAARVNARFERQW
ncbi:hypothetical protein QWE_24041 [Agrobacterium albertimagni AOL15]|uniref:Lipid/polyisoprenoid-binding YceI-like domain-containing protein n=1 Tax=Agrobacterium albertimagni AOL15 TaxID=1156935 RepID=K2PW73_9HYPH|nr:hypothetical protein [Agrobacterium albertimagni]EKF56950.1 hypothetical protein QWE_24041 [Agrobacterium albertimagni AOL15]